MSGKNSLGHCGGTGGRSISRFGLFLAELLCCCSFNPDSPGWRPLRFRWVLPQSRSSSHPSQKCKEVSVTLKYTVICSNRSPVTKLQYFGGCVRFTKHCISQLSVCSPPASQELTLSSFATVMRGLSVSAEPPENFNTQTRILVVSCGKEAKSVFLWPSQQELCKDASSQSLCLYYQELSSAII